MLRYIEINPNEIPVSKTYTIGNSDYTLEFRYNKRFDFITLYITENGEPVFTSKLTYGNNVLYANKKLSFAVIPLSENDLYRVGYEDLHVNTETLGKSVFLYFEDGLS